MMSAKMDTLGFLRNKGYDVIIYVHEVTYQILLRHSNNILDVAMWPFCPSSPSSPHPE